ncbi:MAG: DUF2130 domain-containing protein [Candidatus Levybacteria bacterium]|nr:DUF2130 domain-containing protein [Candidatus Levybacteria bacterium]
MNDDSFSCPHCGKPVEPTRALMHRLGEKVAKEQEKNHKLEIERVKKEAQIQAEKDIKEKIEKELIFSKSANEKLIEELFKLKKNQEEKEKDSKKLEEKIKIEAKKKAEEEVELRLKAKDLQLEQAAKSTDEMKRVNEDLKRKLEQGSQQLQGEALERSLEEKLKQIFPNDDFLPIPKGFEGADILQKVKFKNEIVGSIIWETKRTKAWSNEWIIKLKEDAAKISASEAILVSSVLPNDIGSFDRKDGVWISSYEHAINICRYVRFLITSIWKVKSSTVQTEEEWGLVRDYIMSDAFRHKMQSHFDGISSLRNGLEGEKRSTLIRWKKTENQINKLDLNTINFYAELKTIIPNLPEIKGVNITLIDDGEIKENLLDE